MLQNIKQIKLSDLLRIINDYQFVVVDSKLMELYSKVLRIEQDKLIIVDDPEKQKSYTGWEALVDELLVRNITRKDQVLIIGGGALSDLAGFAASTVLRGVTWSVVPTTLLSMVDAAIGGKVGINHSRGKNLIGAFSQPDTIYLAAEFLDTLSQDEINSGLGEVVKYCFLSPQVYSMVSHRAPLESVILSCATYKKNIVEKDYKEGGERKLLNLGHTLGHAYEKLFVLPHGVAVTIGLQAIISLYRPSLEKTFNELLRKLDLTLPDLPEANFQNFWDYVLMDKKRLSKDAIDLIIPRDIGQVRLEKTDLSDLRKAIQNNEFFKHLK